MRNRFMIAGLALPFLIGTAWAESPDVLRTSKAEPTISAPLGNAINYQGKLNKSGAPVNGNCNFIFSLYAALSGGSQIGVTVNVSNQPVVGGLFTISLDFGAGAFDGQARWLQIQVQGPGDASFTMLAPRQALAAAPYALYALLGPGGSGPWVANSGDLTYSGGGVGVLNGSSPFTSGKGVFLEGGSAQSAAVFGFNYDTFQPLNLSLNSPGGNVGIGTSAPTSKLEIAAQDGLKITGFQPYLTFKDTNDNGKRGIISSGSGDIGIYPESFIGTTPALILKNTTGRLGVGVAAPDGKLQANSSDVAAVVGKHTGNWIGVYGESVGGFGVNGKSTSGTGVVGETFTNGSWGGYFKNWAAGGTALFADGKAAVKTLDILGGSDIVEGFETGKPAVEPGTVVVIDAEHPGELRPSARAYDSRVAGIVSGAGGVSPGLHLGQEGVLDGATPVAMSGRVYVRCTEENGRIHPGDLLTTSNQPGLAMRATDPERSLGAILGKAMTSLDAGTGLVLVLVNLQ